MRPIKLKTFENKGGNIESLNLTDKQKKDYDVYLSDYALKTTPRAIPTLDLDQLSIIDKFIGTVKDAKQKRKSKVNLKEEAKKYYQLDNLLKGLTNHFTTYAINYTEKEVGQFESDLTNFFNDISTIRINKIEELKAANQAAALKEFNAMKEALNKQAEKLKELGLDEKGNPIK